MRVSNALTAALLLTITWTAHAQVVADFTASKLVGVTPMFVQFTNLSTYPNDPDVEFLWDFGDGNTGVGKNVNHMYMTEGIFTVSMAIHVGGVQVATKTREAYITTYDLIPDFEGTPRVSVPPFSATFTNFSSTLGVFPTSFLWDLGDGTTSTSVHPTHVYSQEGIYDVTLYATADGKTVSITKEEYITVVVPHPEFSAVPTSGGVPLDVQFANHTATLGLPVTYLWEFGDGTTSTELHPSHRYLAPGIYTVDLHVTVVNGPTFTLTKTDYIEASLDADFTASPLVGEAPLEVQFTDLTLGITGDTTFEWDFGDGQTSTERHPVHTYNQAGVYTVSLRATVPPSIPHTSTKNDYIFVHNFARESRTHFVAFPESLIQLIAWGTPEQVDLILTISSEKAVSGKVEFPGLESPVNQTFNLDPREAIELTIPLAAMMTGNDFTAPKGGVVTANGRIRVYGLIRQNEITDGFAALPMDALGHTYRTPSTPPSGSQFTILSTAPRTSVVIQPRVGSGAREANLPYTIELDYLEVYQIQFVEDSGGSLISANKPIAVFSGNLCAEIFDLGCDTLVEQVPPVPAWGTNHIVVSLATRDKGEWVRVVAHEDNTEVVIPGPEPESIVLQAGKSAVRLLNGINSITSNKPVLVMQYASSGAFESSHNEPDLGDPFMMTIVPTDRFLTAYTIKTPAPPPQQSATEYINFVNLVVQQSDVINDTLLLDGEPVEAEFTSVANSNYMAARVPISHGVHSLRADKPFGLYLYGFTLAESYGYHGGMSYAGLELEPLPTVDDVLSLRTLFSEYDLNGDGLLTEQELSFASLSAFLFSALDLNGDGYLSLEELLAMSAGKVGATTPVYVDFDRPTVGRGTEFEPFNRFNEAQVFVAPGGTIQILGGSSSERFDGTRRLVKPIRVQSDADVAPTIGESP